MNVYLISYGDTRYIEDSSELQLESFENNNPDFEDGVWITGEMLAQIRQTGFEPSILARMQTIPVFYGPLQTVHRKHYDSALTAISLSRRDGSTVRGVSYLLPYDDYYFCRDLGRCFRYGYGEDPEHNWRVVGHFGDADWLEGYWGEEHNFPEWLESLGNFDRKTSQHSDR